MRPFLIQVTIYEIDLDRLVQKNVETGKVHPIRAVEIQMQADDGRPQKRRRRWHCPTSEASGAQPAALAAAAAAAGTYYSG